MNISDLDNIVEIRERIKDLQERKKRFENEKSSVTVSTNGTYLEVSANSSFNKKLKSLAVNDINNRIVLNRSKLRELGVDPDR